MFILYVLFYSLFFVNLSFALHYVMSLSTWIEDFLSKASLSEESASLLFSLWNVLAISCGIVSYITPLFVTPKNKSCHTNKHFYLLNTSVLT